MIDIVKKRVIDWNLQLRKEKDFNVKFGTNLTLSEVKELTGSFRRLTDKSLDKIGKNKLEPCEEFYLLLDEHKRNQYTDICRKRSAAFFRIGKEPKKTKNHPNDKLIFDNLDQELKIFKEENNWSKVIT
jgi:hypothetical protein